MLPYNIESPYSEPRTTDCVRPVSYIGDRRRYRGNNNNKNETGS